MLKGGRHGDIPQSICISDRIRNYIESYDKLAKTPMSKECKERVLELYKKIRSDGGLIINGKDPRVIAATLIYIAALMTYANITQAQAAKTLGVAVPSIRNKLPRILKFFGEKYRHQEKEFVSTLPWEPFPNPKYYIEHANEWRARIE